MAGPTYDASYNALNQEQQGGGNWVVAGNLAIDTANGGKLYINGTEFTAASGAAVDQVASLTLTPATGGTNISLVTIQAKDYLGNAMARVVALEVWLSDAATGAGETGTTASGAVAAGASGVDLLTVTAKKRLRVKTDATGKYILSITDSAKTGFYVVVTCGDRFAISAQLVSGNYG